MTLGSEPGRERELYRRKGRSRRTLVGQYGAALRFQIIGLD